MPPSASTRFRSATAAVQGRTVGSKRRQSQVATPSITTLVPDVLQSAGPRMTVAAKRNIFMHARSYLQGQSHVKDIHQRKLLVQSVVEGTRLHQKQGDTVTTLQENVAEQQERRKAEEKELEAQRLLEEAAKEEVVEVLEVAKLETLAKSYKDESLIATAVSSAQNCVSLLMTLKSKISDDEDMLKYIREARFSADELSVSLLHDLQGEIAKMREALQSAKETARAESVESEQQKDVLQMVGSIYEDIPSIFFWDGRLADFGQQE